MKKHLTSRLVSFWLALSILLGFTVSCEVLPSGGEPVGGETTAPYESGILSPVTTLAVDTSEAKSGESLDYADLQTRIDEILESQMKAGFQVEEILVLFISEEQIRRDPVMAESFLRLTLGELEAFHDQPLRLTHEGVTEGEVIPESFVPEAVGGADWNAYLGKMILGTGILVISATLSVATGGTYLCALTTLLGASAAEAGIAAGTSFLFNYAASLSRGDSQADAIASALGVAADAGSSAFLSNAIVGALMTPLVKLCFPEGTLVLTEAGPLPIEEICPGDLVYTRAEDGRVELQPVVDMQMGKASDRLTVLHLENGQTVTATPAHPFYAPQEDEYIPAEELEPGDAVLTLDGEAVRVSRVEERSLEEPCTVWNLSAAVNHCYFVSGEEESEWLLVHNSCLHRSGKWIRERRQYWRSQADFYDMRPELLDTRALSGTYTVSEKNLALMRRGRAPFGLDNRRVELHHYLDGGIEKNLYVYREITATEHHTRYAELHAWLFRKTTSG